MKIPVLIISGFLGAGKTTCIQQLINEISSDKKILLIENDFGQINVDSALFDSKKIEIRELTSGCICCSLSSNFSAELETVINSFPIDLIIIEPSGVGKLSEIKKACLVNSLKDKLNIINAITVVDATRAELYMLNFGDFFKDQVKEANLILLSHNEIDQEKLNPTIAKIKDLNDSANIINEKWSSLNFKTLFNLENNTKDLLCCHANNLTNHSHNSSQENHCHHSCNHNHDHQIKHHNDHEHHHHSAAISSHTIECPKPISHAALDNAFAYISNNSNLVRAKGFINLAEKNNQANDFLVQYVAKELNLVPKQNIPKVYSLTFIGKNFDNIDWQKVKVLLYE